MPHPNWSGDRSQDPAIYCLADQWTRKVNTQLTQSCKKYKMYIIGFYTHYGLQSVSAMGPAGQNGVDCSLLTFSLTISSFSNCPDIVTYLLFFLQLPWHNCTGWLGVKHQVTYLLFFLQQLSNVWHFGEQFGGKDGECSFLPIRISLGNRPWRDIRWTRYGSGMCCLQPLLDSLHCSFCFAIILMIHWRPCGVSKPTLSQSCWSQYWRAVASIVPDTNKIQDAMDSEDYILLFSLIFVVVVCLLRQWISIDRKK